MKLSYKYRVRKRGRGRDLDSGVNRESLASRKSGERISVNALLFNIVQIYSSFFFCYFQLQTQIHFGILFSYSLIYCFIVIIIRYLYNWYLILDPGFKPVNSYHTQLRSDGGTCRRVRETNDGPRSDVRGDIE